MATTYVLTSICDGDTNVIAAGNDIDMLRQKLRRIAHVLIRKRNYAAPERKALRKERLEALKDPDIMEWDDGETKDPYRLSIKEVPLHDKRTKKEEEDAPESLERKLFAFLISKFLLTEPEEIFYENQDIQSEGISARIPGSKEEIEAVSVSASRVTVTLIQYGESGDGRGDLTRNVPMAELDVSVQQKILDFVTKNF